MQHCRWGNEGFGNYGHGRCIEHRNDKGQIIHLTCADCNLCLPPNVRPFGSHLTEFETVSKQLFHTTKLMSNVTKDNKNLLNQKSKLTSRLCGLQKCIVNQETRIENLRLEITKSKNKIIEKNVFFSGILQDKDAEILKLKREIKALKISHAQENALTEQVISGLKKKYEEKYEQKINSLNTNIVKSKHLENVVPEVEETKQVSKKKKSKKKKKKVAEYDDDAFLHEVDLQVKAYREGAEKLQKKHDELLQTTCRQKTKMIEQNKAIVLLGNELKKEKDKFTKLNNIKASIMVYACQASMFCMFARMNKSTSKWHDLLKCSMGLCSKKDTKSKYDNPNADEWGHKNPQDVTCGFRSIIMREGKILMNKNLAFNEIAEQMQLKVRQIVCARRNACRILQRWFRRVWRSNQ